MIRLQLVFCNLGKWNLAGFLKIPRATMNDPVREQVMNLLRGGQAHLTLDDVVKNFPQKLRGAKVDGSPHTAWELLEHLRLAQWDILEFSRNAKHVSPPWPEGYWPEADAPPNAAAWDASVAAFRRDWGEMEKLVKDPANNLFAPIPHGQGQTLLREALL